MKNNWEIQEKIVNKLRFNVVNMVECAGNGHWGSALGIAPTLYVLYSKHMKVVPSKDKHPLRDRFVLSNGHASAILYAVLNTLGYDITVEDLKNFRKFDSITSSHPSIKTAGIDCNTGALGQGVANAVGMAISERLLAERVNNDNYKLIDNYTYVMAGDGCMMEGVSFEALSLAGALKLNKLIVLYDRNKTTIEGKLDNIFEINPKMYAKSLGFSVIEVEDGNNLQQIDDALTEAKKSQDKPVFIIINTKIGYGSALEDTEKAHAGKLGQSGIKYLKEKLNITGEPFEFEKIEKDFIKENNKRFKLIKQQFDERIDYYKKNFKSNFEIFNKFTQNIKPDLKEFLSNLKQDDGVATTTQFSGQILKELTLKDEFIVGGSADLSRTTCVKLGKHSINESFKNNELFYGIREFAMSCISNGLALYGFKPFCSTFLAFSDYMRSGIRLSALMNLPINYILSHDGISSAEDGATHHAIDQLVSLRAIPNLQVYRPCDFNEVKACYYNAYTGVGPSVMSVSKLVADKYNSDFEQALLGGYILKRESKSKPEIIIVASGSDVKFAVDSAKDLELQNYGARVVSMPCFEIFDKQSDKYKEEVLPKDVVKISIESGVTFGWDKYINKGIKIGFDGFTQSGEREKIYKENGFDIKKLLKIALKLIKNK